MNKQNEASDEQRALLLLEILYELGRGDVPATPATLAEWTDLPEAAVRDLMPRLDAQGLVDLGTCRLTMQGLVLAVTLAGSRKVAKDAA
ncbi:MAG: hypothetical protein AAF997_08550 [Myxococcota bacterium]